MTRNALNVGKSDFDINRITIIQMVEKEFEESWLSMRMVEKERLRAIDENTYVCTGGHVLYLISAKK